MKTRGLIVMSLWLTAGCFGPIGIGAVKPNPFVRGIDGTKDKTLQVFLAPGVQDAFQIEPTNMRPIDVSQFRTSLRDGLASALSGSFKELLFVDSAPALGLVLQVERCEPRGVKAANVPMGEGIVAYDLRFDVRYIATLKEDGRVVANTQNEVTGKDTSWKAADQPRLLANSLELMITDLRERLFVSK